MSWVLSIQVRIVKDIITCNYYHPVANMWLEISGSKMGNTANTDIFQLATLVFTHIYIYIPRVIANHFLATPFLISVNCALLCGIFYFSQMSGLQCLSFDRALSEWLEVFFVRLKKGSPTVNNNYKLQCWELRWSVFHHWDQSPVGQKKTNMRICLSFCLEKEERFPIFEKHPEKTVELI